MLVKKVFNPIAIFRYMRQELMVSLFLSIVVYTYYHQWGWQKLSLPFSIVAILGSALAIFIAFRNQSSYARWWEARTIWGGIINNSRIFARQLIANVDHAVAIGKVQPEQAVSYKKEMVNRQIAFAHALRLHLRGQSSWEEVKHLLSEEEYQRLLISSNKPNVLLHIQGVRIKEAMRVEMLGAFDNISMEPNLATFNNWQGSCERIKNTPLLRQYHYFTKLFLWVFMFTLPLALAADFEKMQISFLLIPVSVLISFVFGTMAKVGEVNEEPFNNTITDVPLTSLCNIIERDLLEVLGENNLPAKLIPVNGILD